MSALAGPTEFSTLAQAAQASASRQAAVAAASAAGGTRRRSHHKREDALAAAAVAATTATDSKVAAAPAVATLRIEAPAPDSTSKLDVKASVISGASAGGVSAAAAGAAAAGPAGAVSVAVSAAEARVDSPSPTALEATRAADTSPVAGPAAVSTTVETAVATTAKKVTATLITSENEAIRLITTFIKEATDTVIQDGNNLADRVIFGSVSRRYQETRDRARIYLKAATVVNSKIFARTESADSIFIKKCHVLTTRFAELNAGNIDMAQRVSAMQKKLQETDAFLARGLEKLSSLDGLVVCEKGNDAPKVIKASEPLIFEYTKQMNERRVHLIEIQAELEATWATSMQYSDEAATKLNELKMRNGEATERSFIGQLTLKRPVVSSFRYSPEIILEHSEKAQAAQGKLKEAQATLETAKAALEKAKSTQGEYKPDTNKLDPKAVAEEKAKLQAEVTEKTAQVSAWEAKIREFSTAITYAESYIKGSV